MHAFFASLAIELCSGQHCCWPHTVWYIPLSACCLKHACHKKQGAMLCLDSCTCMLALGTACIVQVHYSRFSEQLSCYDIQDPSSIRGPTTDCSVCSADSDCLSGLCGLLDDRNYFCLPISQRCPVSSVQMGVRIYNVIDDEYIAV
jgi:hypothetical protein